MSSFEFRVSSFLVAVSNPKLETRMRTRKSYTCVVDEDVSLPITPSQHSYLKLMRQALELQFLYVMKHTKLQYRVCLTATLCLLLSFLTFGAVPMSEASQEKATAKAALTPEQEKELVAAFDRHVKDYLKQRSRVKEKLPALSKEATPEQITAYQKSFVEALRAMRAGTKQGYIFNAQFADYLRTIIKTELPPRDKSEIREVVLEADTKGVPLRVNYPYPETKELTQMPPTLLLKLPQLPKEVKYRYVGRNMLLVDTDNGLIVDYMLNALP